MVRQTLVGPQHGGCASMIDVSGWRCGEHVSRKRVGGVDEWNSLATHSVQQAVCVCQRGNIIY